MKYLSRLLTASLRKPLTATFIWLATAFIALVFVGRIQIDMDIANLLPHDNPHVQTMQLLTETLGGEDSFEVIVASGSFERNLELGNAVASRLMGVNGNDGPLILRYQLKTDTRILREYPLYFLTMTELDQLHEALQDQRERALLEANPFFVNLDDEEDNEGHDWMVTISIPDEYIVSPDSTALLISFYPSGSKGDIGYVRELFAATDSVISAFNQDFPDAGVVYGGNLRNHLTKFEDIEATLQFAVVFGVTGVFLFIVLYSSRLANRYRRRKANQGLVAGLLSQTIWGGTVVVVILIPIILSLLITYAAGHLLFGTLNIMTTVLIAILLGVNLDYVLHFFSSFMQYRSKMRLPRALMETFHDCGKALLISCLTSSLAMLILLFSGFRGFYEFGALFFAGIVTTYIATISIFPILLVGIERIGLSLDKIASNTSASPLAEANHTADSDKPTAIRAPVGPVASLIYRSALPLLVVIGFFTLIALAGLPRVSFEYAFNELEPRPVTQPDFQRLRDTFTSAYRSDPAYFLFDTPETAREAASRLASADLYETIGHVESLHARIPQNEQKNRLKLAKIADIRGLTQDPLVETALQDALNAPDTDTQTREMLELLIAGANQVSAPDLTELPEVFRDRFTDRDGEIVNLVIINPNMMLADGRASLWFKSDAGTVEAGGQTWYAASTAIIGASILEIMQREAWWLMFAPLVMALMCLLIFFRSAYWGLMTFLPLAVGVLLLTGVMGLVGLKFNIYNIIVLPAVLGVGADNGIHLFHRLRERRFAHFGEVLAGTGTFITASSFTTVLGFAGLMFTNHPGLQSMGYVAVAGIGLTLICAVVVATATAKWSGGFQSLQPKTDE